VSGRRDLLQAIFLAQDSAIKGSFPPGFFRLRFTQIVGEILSSLFGRWVGYANYLPLMCVENLGKLALNLVIKLWAETFAFSASVGGKQFLFSAFLFAQRVLMQAVNLKYN